MKILLIEDDDPIATIIQLALDRAQYTVERAAAGPEGLRLAQAHPYELIILDVMLPGMDGWTICRTLREQRINTPILMLTALDSADNRVSGLDLGADDYLPKPFHVPELLARVRVLAQRDDATRMRFLRVADLEIDTTTARVTRAGADIPLTRREYALLKTLAANEGSYLSRRELRKKLSLDDEDEDSLGTAWEGLWRKIDDPHETKLLFAMGSGYMLNAPDDEPRERSTSAAG